MPSMFSRRRASSQPPRPSAPVSSSAAIAASSAFLQSSTSQASLSSAAAAAALRSHTTSPEPIGNLQTKRMMRRGSQTSLGGSNGVGRPGGANGMVRRDSSSSMTERNFRSPSPGRSEAVPQAADAPPVPSIPKKLTGGRRSASVEPTVRQSMTSPTPRRGGRNSSVDIGGRSAGQTAAVKAATAKPADLARENSLNSVNFSRPMSPAMGVPARPQSAAGWFSSPTVGTGSPRTSILDKQNGPPAAMSATQARQVEREIQNAANKPVLKKKKQAVEANEGDRLSQGTMHPGPTGTAVQNTPSPSASSILAASQAAAAPQQQTLDGDGTPVKRKKKVAVLDTDVEAVPPPKNPARFSPSRDDNKSPVSARAAGLLHKQPSVVREDPEAEYRAERQLPGRSVSVNHSASVIHTSEGPARAYIAPDAAPHQRAVSLDIPRDGMLSSSLSPNRNVHARFSDVITVNSPSSRHQPPPRSVSPFKSALKHSPSSSVRGNSPATTGRNGSLSDTHSMASQDGIKPGKKKSARVSFDDGGTTVSQPAPVTPNSSKPIRRELSPAAVDDSDADETMTPRPALPSFGSVRSRKTPSPERVEKVTETVNSSTSTSVATLPDRSEASSDHAAGAVLANHFAEKETAAQQAPLPPQVTSVQGSGYSSDSSSASSRDHATSRFSLAPSGAPDVEHNEFVDASPAVSTGKNDTTERSLPAPLESPADRPSANETEKFIALPDISVQPATPGIEEDKPILDSPGKATKAPARYSIPGGWDDLEETKSEPSAAPRVEPIATEEPDFESSDEEDGLAAPEVDTERHSPILEPIYESDSDNSDAFSDAAEDPSEFDGGFASLDAIVESPVQPHSPAFDISTPPESPSTRLPPPRMSVPQPSPLSNAVPMENDEDDEDGDWSHATAYWSSLTRERKEQMERQAQAAEDALPVTQSPKPKKRSQPPIISAPQMKERPQPQNEPEPVRRSAPVQAEPRAPAIKKTLRQSPGPAPAAASNTTHMKSSLRSGGGGGGGMRSSMRQEPTLRSSAAAEPRGALQKKRIPSAPSAGSLTAATAAARGPPPAAIAKAAPPTTDDSDSESSFRKQRRRGSVSTLDSQGPYSMKRSMRGQSVDAGADRRPTSPTPAPRGSGRFSVRSLSPNGSLMGRNKGENIRASLRGPVDDAPTMRGKNSKAARDSKSPTRFSMSGFSKARPVSAAGPPPPRSTGRSSGMFKSRFVDSDDEDDGAPSSGMGFRSRFADSDDEDSPVGPPKRMPVNLAPVRGIRSRQRDDDSTDLDDSDEEARTGKTKRPSSRVSSKPPVPAEADIEAAMAAARRNVAAMNGGREPGVMPETNGVPKKQTAAAVPESQSNGVNGSLGPASPPLATPGTPSKRRGFMGSMLGRRRTSSVASVPQIPSSYFASPAGSTNPASPMPQGVQSPPGKLQRRTTKRMNSSMSAVSQSHQSQAMQQSATTPSLPSMPSQNWPLVANGEQRPATSDGVEMRRTMRGGGGIVSRAPRPELGRRSISGGDLDRTTKKNAVYSEKTGKKKRFGMLRNIFGLND